MLDAKCQHLAVSVLYMWPLRQKGCDIQQLNGPVVKSVLDTRSLG